MWKKNQKTEFSGNCILVSTVDTCAANINSMMVTITGNGISDPS